MSFFLTNSTPPVNFTEITTNIQYTSLLGSQDLSPFFDSNHPEQRTASDQRLEDIALARNRTLDVLIEELTFNITISLMSSDLISYANHSILLPITNLRQAFCKRDGNSHRPHQRVRLPSQKPLTILWRCDSPGPFREHPWCHCLLHQQSEP